MGLDINDLRQQKGGNPQQVRESCRKRRKDPLMVDGIIKLDQQWRKCKFELDNLKKEYNIINKQLGQRFKTQGKDIDISKQQQLLKMNVQKQEKTKQAQGKLLRDIQHGLNNLGNIVHPSVPDSADEKDNVVVSTWGTPKKIPMLRKPGFCHHHQILHMIGGYDARRGQRLAGHRGYFLTGVGALLNLALINYGVSFLAARQYTPIQPPYFMKKQAMAKTSQLSDFDQQLYKIQDDKNDSAYLIATSQQPISALYMNEWLDQKSLPIRYAGMSTCFRKEAGAHGKDAWGIFRVHQFQKIQQFVISKPQQSWKLHQQMIKTAQQFYRTLQLPYQVINIVSGQLNDAAAKKYDLEAWFPGYGQLVSCSNCTDYQSRALEIRCGNRKQGGKGKAEGKKEKKQKPEKKQKKQKKQKTQKIQKQQKQQQKQQKKELQAQHETKQQVEEKGKQPEKAYVHLLNATLCATERTLCCILQNYQREDGVQVPKVLRPFMGGLEIMPYIKQLPKKQDLGQAPKN